MSDDNKDTSAHPMYYTEAYHRAQVDKDLYAIKSGLGGAAVGAVGGAFASKSLIKMAEEAAELGAREILPGAMKFGIRSSAVLGGAIALGTVTAVIGGAIGYIHAIAKGPRPQQLNGWTGKVENERSQASSEQART